MPYPDSAFNYFILYYLSNLCFVICHLKFHFLFSIFLTSYLQNFLSLCFPLSPFLLVLPVCLELPSIAFLLVYTDFSQKILITTLRNFETFKIKYTFCQNNPQFSPIIAIILLKYTQPCCEGLTSIKICIYYH